MSAPLDGFPKTAAVSPRVAYVESTGSTNADMVRAAGDTAELPHLSVELTFDQRSGRGRLDRVWEAPAGSALALSVLLRVAELPVAARGWIPLAAGEAMTRAIAAQLPGRDVSSKWPNDVRVGDDKICGILAEATLSLDAVVVGAGVNTTMTAEQLPVPAATSFAVLGAECDVDRLMADFVERLARSVRGLVKERGDAQASGLLGDVSRACSTIGRAVRVERPGDDALTGTATAIDEAGRLIVEDATGTPVSVAAGDIVHLRAAD